MSVDLMPNRYRPGEADLAPREADLIARRDGVLGASYRPVSYTHLRAHET